MSSPIVFYDIPGKHPKYNAWSPNTWKTRYALAFKGLPFKTEYVEYPDIEALCKKIGAKPTDTKKDGSPHYTFPVIYDPNTKTVVEDSLNIARYLDKTYPDTPRLFPDNTHVLQNAFLAASGSAVMMPLFTVVILATCNNLNPRSEEYFRRTREVSFSKALEDFVPAGEEGAKRWKEVEEGFDKIASWFTDSDQSGPFVMGNIPSYADVDLASRLIWAKVVLGEDSEGWGKIKQWSGGRWEQHLKLMEKYENLA
ncbi:hypothetical protein QCA50_006841 [Cerrena zonata]|uniref:GST N-terminal domain-containing protein n=1 Tax=Cerrena zonata TaxID=2478898 RepID=A0AAW0GM69_9APHY